MNNDVIPYAILVVVTAFVPLITNLINNRHQTKLRNLEIADETKRYNLNHKVNALENALFGIGQYSTGKGNENEFAKLVFPAIPFMSVKTKNKVIELYESIFLRTNTNDIELVKKVVELMTEDIQRHLN